ncbi:MAG: hypothetical protein WC934_06050 [Acidithiobacillus sp.]
MNKLSVYDIYFIYHDGTILTEVPSCECSFKPCTCKDVIIEISNAESIHTDDIFEIGQIINGGHKILWKKN